MSDFIEGKRPLIEALRADVPLSEILMANNLKRDKLVEDIVKQARKRSVPVHQIARNRIDEMAGHANHQGVLGRTRPFDYRTVEEIVDVAQAYADEHEGRALIVICDHLTDAGNLGAIVRSAESVGASGVIIPNKRSAKVEASTYKSSAGAIAHMPIAMTANIVQAMGKLQAAGFWAFAASEHARDDIWDVNLKGKVVLVVGNEHDGVSHLVFEHCDFSGKLPQMGHVSSLNVAQASTACMYEWLRQNRNIEEASSGK